MINRLNLLASGIAVTSLLVLSGPAAASTFEEVQIKKEVESCIAELAEHANYNDADRVEHEVTVSRRRAIGHKLDISTFVYSDSSDQAIREYATKCIVYGGRKPVRFEVREAQSGA